MPDTEIEHVLIDTERVVVTDSAQEETALSVLSGVDVADLLTVRCTTSCTLERLLSVLAASAHPEALQHAVNAAACCSANIIERLLRAARAAPQGPRHARTLRITPPSLQAGPESCSGEEGWTLTANGDGRPAEYRPVCEIARCPLVVDHEQRVMDWSLDAETVEGFVVATARVEPTLFDVVRAVVWTLTWGDPVMPDGMGDLAPRGALSDAWE